MGAPPQDYEKVAPENSYIHVDDYEGPQHLAEYLHLLDKNDDLYNEYFRFKGSGRFLTTRFWCRLCAMLHAERPPTWIPDLYEWWSGKNVCRPYSWRDESYDVYR